MSDPSASTPGSLNGKRSWPQIKIGSVGSVPPRKNAIMNSSKEIVKHSKKLATIPGATIGKVTLQNVDHGLAPRSEDASSMDGSNPSKRDIKVAIANGTEISTWAMAMVYKDRLNPRRVTRISSATPIMMSGTTIGSIITNMIGFTPGIR